MEGSDYSLGMTKLIICMASVIGNLHNELDTPGFSLLSHLSSTFIKLDDPVPTTSTSGFSAETSAIPSKHS